MDVPGGVEQYPVVGEMTIFNICLKTNRLPTCGFEVVTTKVGDCCSPPELIRQVTSLTTIERILYLNILIQILLHDKQHLASARNCALKTVFSFFKQRFNIFQRDTPYIYIFL